MRDDFLFRVKKSYMKYLLEKNFITMRAENTLYKNTAEKKNDFKNMHKTYQQKAKPFNLVTRTIINSTTFISSS